jgi:hypothetical protein
VKKYIGFLILAIVIKGSSRNYYGALHLERDNMIRKGIDKGMLYIIELGSQ